MSTQGFVLSPNPPALLGVLSKELYRQEATKDPDHFLLCMPTKAVPYRSSQNTPRVSFGPPGFFASAEVLAPKVAVCFFFFIL